MSRAHLQVELPVARAPWLSPWLHLASDIEYIQESLQRGNGPSLRVVLAKAEAAK